MDYIYHKKPDGNIIPIEVTEENREQKIRAYSLDRELMEQRGGEYGTIYKSIDELPDEDKITLGIISEEEAKQKKAKESAQKLVAQARQYLAETDYLIIKEMDTGEKCPEEIRKNRQGARVMIRTCENGGIADGKG